MLNIALSGLNDWLETLEQIKQHQSAMVMKPPQFPQAFSPTAITFWVDDVEITSAVGMIINMTPVKLVISFSGEQSALLVKNAIPREKIPNPHKTLESDLLHIKSTANDSYKSKSLEQDDEQPLKSQTKEPTPRRRSILSNSPISPRSRSGNIRRSGAQPFTDLPDPRKTGEHLSLQRSDQTESANKSRENHILSPRSRSGTIRRSGAQPFTDLPDPLKTGEHLSIQKNDTGENLIKSGELSQLQRNDAGEPRQRKPRDTRENHLLSPRTGGIRRSGVKSLSDPTDSRKSSVHRSIQDQTHKNNTTAKDLVKPQQDLTPESDSHLSNLDLDAVHNTISTNSNPQRHATDGLEASNTSHIFQSGESELADDTSFDTGRHIGQSTPEPSAETQPLMLTASAVDELGSPLEDTLRSPLEDALAPAVNEPDVTEVVATFDSPLSAALNEKEIEFSFETEDDSETSSRKRVRKHRGTSESTAPLWKRYDNMTKVEKIRLAKYGGPNERRLVFKDRDASLHIYLLNNPGLSGSELAGIIRSGGASSSMIQQISKKNNLVSNPTVIDALVHCPQTPIPIAVKLISRVPIGTVRRIAKRNHLREPIIAAARKRSQR